MSFTLLPGGIFEGHLILEFVCLGDKPPVYEELGLVRIEPQLKNISIYSSLNSEDLSQKWMTQCPKDGFFSRYKLNDVYFGPRDFYAEAHSRG